MSEGGLEPGSAGNFPDWGNHEVRIAGEIPRPPGIRVSRHGVLPAAGRSPAALAARAARGESLSFSFAAGSVGIGPTLQAG